MSGCSAAALLLRLFCHVLLVVVSWFVVVLLAVV